MRSKLLYFFHILIIVSLFITIAKVEATKSKKLKKLKRVRSFDIENDVDDGEKFKSSKIQISTVDPEVRKIFVGANFEAIREELEKGLDIFSTLIWDDLLDSKLIEPVKYLINGGHVPLKMIDKTFKVAIESGWYELFEFIFANHSNEIHENQYEHFKCALKLNRFAILEKMAEYNFGFNETGESDFIIEDHLHMAVEEDQIERVVVLLKFPHFTVDSVDVNGNTPLHFTRSEEMTKLLMSQSPNLKLKNSHGQTALDVAVNFGTYEIVKLIEPNVQIRLKKLAQLNRGARIKIKVDRNTILEDSFILVSKRSQEWYSPHKNFEIEFVGETGIDSGGLTREWYSLLFSRFFDSKANVKASQTSAQAGEYVNTEAAMQIDDTVAENLNAPSLSGTEELVPVSFAPVDVGTNVEALDDSNSSVGTIDPNFMQLINSNSGLANGEEDEVSDVPTLLDQFMDSADVVENENDERSDDVVENVENANDEQNAVVENVESDFIGVRNAMIHVVNATGGQGSFVLFINTRNIANHPRQGMGNVEEGHQRQNPSEVFEALARNEMFTAFSGIANFLNRLMPSSLTSLEVKEDERVHFFNAPFECIDLDNKTFRISSQFTGHCGVYRFIGSIIAKSLFYKIPLRVKLAPSLLKLLFGKKDLDIEDLKDDDLVMYNGLKACLKKDFDFEMCAMTLLSDLSVPVDAQNVDQYLEEMAYHTMYLKYAPQIEALIDGFRSIYPLENLRALLSLEELSLILQGEEHVDRSQLKEIISIEGANWKCKEEIFWAALNELSDVELADFIRFMTGIHGIPYGGITQIQGKITVHDERTYKTMRASSCSLILFLPTVIETLDELLKDIRIALNSDQGFSDRIN